MQNVIVNNNNISSIHSDEKKLKSQSDDPENIQGTELEAVETNSSSMEQRE